MQYIIIYYTADCMTLSIEANYKKKSYAFQPAHYFIDMACDACPYMKVNLSRYIILMQAWFIILLNTFTCLSFLKMYYTVKVYTTKGVNKIPVPQGQAYFPRRTRILLTFAMFYFNCFIIPIRSL